jgi:hypothetical protein
MKEILYFKLIINTQNVKMNLEKMQAIIDWKMLELMKEVLFFTKFANIYRRFIENYSSKIKSFTQLTQKEQ